MHAWAGQPSRDSSRRQVHASGAIRNTPSHRPAPSQSLISPAAMSVWWDRITSQVPSGREWTTDQVWGGRDGDSESELVM